MIWEMLMMVPLEPTLTIVLILLERSSERDVLLPASSRAEFNSWLIRLSNVCSKVRPALTSSFPVDRNCSHQSTNQSIELVILTHQIDSIDCVQNEGKIKNNVEDYNEKLWNFLIPECNWLRSSWALALAASIVLLMDFIVASSAIVSLIPIVKLCCNNLNIILQHMRSNEAKDYLKKRDNNWILRKSNSFLLFFCFSLPQSLSIITLIFTRSCHYTYQWLISCWHWSKKVLQTSGPYSNQMTWMSPPSIFPTPFLSRMPASNSPCSIITSVSEWSESKSVRNTIMRD